MFDKIKIRSGIPIPSRNSHSHLGAVASKMKVGDCVEVSKNEVVRMCQCIRHRYGNSSATMRKLTDDTWLCVEK